MFFLAVRQQVRTDATKHDLPFVLCTWHKPIHRLRPRRGNSRVPTNLRHLLASHRLPHRARRCEAMAEIDGKNSQAENVRQHSPPTWLAFLVFGGVRIVGRVDVKSARWREFHPRSMRLQSRRKRDQSIDPTDSLAHFGVSFGLRFVLPLSFHSVTNIGEVIELATRCLKAAVPMIQIENPGDGNRMS